MCIACASVKGDGLEPGLLAGDLPPDLSGDLSSELIRKSARFIINVEFKVVLVMMMKLP